MSRPQKKHVSLRVDEPTLTALDRQARLSGSSRNALAERYLAEGLAMEEFPQIHFRDGGLGRRAALLGTRVDVWQVLETLRTHDNSVEQTADYLNISVALVRAAVRYYATHRDDVDAFAARAIATAERAEAVWRAEQVILAS